MNLGFIGTGKISSAVVRGLCTSDRKDLAIMLSPRNERVSLGLSQTYANVTRCESNQQVLDRSDVIFLAVRPGDARQVLGELVFRADHTVVSLVPFLLLADLQRAAAPAGHCCRAIPLPTVVHHRCPIPLLNGNDAISGLFSAMGQPLIVEDEHQLHVLWTVTGLISPFYDLLGELGEWSRGQGVAPDLANRFAVDMFEALCLAAQQANPLAFAELSHHAATPQGMNEQASRDIRAMGAHAAYPKVLDRLLERFPVTGLEPN